MQLPKDENLDEAEAMTRVDYEYGLKGVQLVTNFHQVSDCQGDQEP